MSIAIVVQARTGSTRLPGKVMLPCAGGTVLGRMLERLTTARHAERVIVATTTLADDDAIAEVGHRTGVAVYRGHPTDLLARHLGAAREANADTVVKVPSDCPLIDPATIDRVVGEFVANQARVDYVSNLHPPTWPDGCDVEVMPAELLELAAREATRPLDREHTTPYFWDNPDRFRIHNVRWETGRDDSLRYRLTLDYPEDYVLIRSVYGALWSPTRVFSLAEVLAYLDEMPGVRALNTMHIGTSWYQHHPGELRTLAKEARR